MLGAVISIRSTVRDFLRLEAAGGILLFAGGAAAMVCANTAAAELYGYFLGTPVQIRVGAFEIAKPLLLWINDGLMAVFFLFVGLELKREVLRGKLSRPSQVALPALAAAGGMLAPGLIYAGLNWGNELTMRGWAIPTATDIAFAVGVLALLGSRVPPALKLFVLTLAILDDLGAILVIAFFYTEKIALGALGVAAVAVAALAVLNRRGVVEIQPYLFIGLVLWAAVLKSGIHATIAGVLLAMFIPLRVPDDPPPLVRLEHELHEVVRVRQFGRVPGRRDACGLAREGARGHRRRPRDRQARRRLRRELARDPARDRPLARRCRLDAPAWRRPLVRHRLHDEPVHRHARFPG